MKTSSEEAIEKTRQMVEETKRIIEGLNAEKRTHHRSFDVSKEQGSQASQRVRTVGRDGNKVA